MKATYMANKVSCGSGSGAALGVWSNNVRQ